MDEHQFIVAVYALLGLDPGTELRTVFSCLAERLMRDSRYEPLIFPTPASDKKAGIGMGSDEFINALCALCDSGRNSHDLGAVYDFISKTVRYWRAMRKDYPAGTTCDPGSLPTLPNEDWLNRSYNPPAIIDRHHQAIITILRYLKARDAK